MVACSLSQETGRTKHGGVLTEEATHAENTVKRSMFGAIQCSNSLLEHSQVTRDITTDQDFHHRVVRIQVEILCFPTASHKHKTLRRY